jgi:hypothetical protein
MGRDGTGLGRTIAAVLRGGTIIAVLGIGAGFGLAILDGAGSPGPTPVIDAIRGGGPDALIGLGLLVLTLTPLVALAAAALILARSGELRPAGMAAVVVVLLAGSLALAAALGPAI